MQAAHHGADRDAEHVGRVGVRAAVPVDDLDDPRKRGGRSSSARATAASSARSTNAVGGRSRSMPGSAWRRRSRARRPAGAPQAVEVRVAHDGQQPGPGVAPVEGVDRAVGSKEGVLDEVLGVGLAPGERPGHTVEDVEFGHDVQLERVDRSIASPPSRRETRSSIAGDPPRRTVVLRDAPMTLPASRTIGAAVPAGARGRSAGRRREVDGARRHRVSSPGRAAPMGPPAVGIGPGRDGCAARQRRRRSRARGPRRRCQRCERDGR